MTFTKVKNDKEINLIRQSGQILGTVFALLKKSIEPGITTKELDEIARQELKRLDAKAAFLGYAGFPFSICASINDEIVHGMPSDRKLKKTDIISIDLGVDYGGMISDSAFTVVVQSNDSNDVLRLLEGTEQSLLAGLNVIKDGVRIGDISNAIENVLKKYQLGIVRELVGHGVGHQVHEEPNIPNYGLPNTGPILNAGMTVAIEPMAMLGAEKIITLDDGWTIATVDKSLSAHFEHTVLVTKNGMEILTTI